MSKAFFKSSLVVIWVVVWRPREPSRGLTMRGPPTVSKCFSAASHLVKLPPFDTAILFFVKNCLSIALSSIQPMRMSALPPRRGKPIKICLWPLEVTILNWSVALPDIRNAPMYHPRARASSIRTCPRSDTPSTFSASNLAMPKNKNMALTALNIPSTKTTQKIPSFVLKNDCDIGSMIIEALESKRARKWDTGLLPQCGQVAAATFEFVIWPM